MSQSSYATTPGSIPPPAPWATAQTGSGGGAVGSGVVSGNEESHMTTGQRLQGLRELHAATNNANSAFVKEVSLALSDRQRQRTQATLRRVQHRLKFPLPAPEPIQDAAQIQLLMKRRGRKGRLGHKSRGGESKRKKKRQQQEEAKSQGGSPATKAGGGQGGTAVAVGSLSAAVSQRDKEEQRKQKKAEKQMEKQEERAGLLDIAVDVGDDDSTSDDDDDDLVVLEREMPVPPDHPVTSAAVTVELADAIAGSDNALESHQNTMQGGERRRQQRALQTYLRLTQGGTGDVSSAFGTGAAKQQRGGNPPKLVIPPVNLRALANPNPYQNPNPNATSRDTDTASTKVTDPRRDSGDVGLMTWHQGPNPRGEKGNGVVSRLLRPTESASARGVVIPRRADLSPGRIAALTLGSSDLASVATNIVAQQSANANGGGDRAGLSDDHRGSGVMVESELGTAAAVTARSAAGAQLQRSPRQIAATLFSTTMPSSSSKTTLTVSVDLPSITEDRALSARAPPRGGIRGQGRNVYRAPLPPQPRPRRESADVLMIAGGPEDARGDKGADRSGGKSTTFLTGDGIATARITDGKNSGQHPPGALGYRSLAAGGGRISPPRAGAGVGASDLDGGVSHPPSFRSPRRVSIGAASHQSVSGGSPPLGTPRAGTGASCQSGGATPRGKAPAPGRSANTTTISRGMHGELKIKSGRMLQIVGPNEALDFAASVSRTASFARTSSFQTATRVGSLQQLRQQPIPHEQQQHLLEQERLKTKQQQQQQQQQDHPQMPLPRPKGRGAEQQPSPKHKSGPHSPSHSHPQAPSQKNRQHRSLSDGGQFYQFTPKQEDVMFDSQVRKRSLAQALRSPVHDGTAQRNFPHQKGSIPKHVPSRTRSTSSDTDSEDREARARVVRELQEDGRGAQHVAPLMRSPIDVSSPHTRALHSPHSAGSAPKIATAHHHTSQEHQGHKHPRPPQQMRPSTLAEKRTSPLGSSPLDHVTLSAAPPMSAGPRPGSVGMSRLDDPDPSSHCVQEERTHGVHGSSGAAPLESGGVSPTQAQRILTPRPQSVPPTVASPKRNKDGHNIVPGSQVPVAHPFTASSSSQFTRTQQSANPHPEKFAQQVSAPAPTARRGGACRGREMSTDPVIAKFAAMATDSTSTRMTSSGVPTASAGGLGHLLPGAKSTMGSGDKSGGGGGGAGGSGYFNPSFMASARDASISKQYKSPVAPGEVSRTLGSAGPRPTVRPVIVDGSATNPSSHSRGGMHATFSSSSDPQPAVTSKTGNSEFYDRLCDPTLAGESRGEKVPSSPSTKATAGGSPRMSPRFFSLDPHAHDREADARPTAMSVLANSSHTTEPTATATENERASSGTFANAGLVAADAQIAEQEPGPGQGQGNGEGQLHGSVASVETAVGGDPSGRRETVRPGHLPTSGARGGIKSELHADSLALRASDSTAAGESPKAMSLLARRNPNPDQSSRLLDVSSQNKSQLGTEGGEDNSTAGQQVLQQPLLLIVDDEEAEKKSFEARKIERALSISERTVGRRASLAQGPTWRKSEAEDLLEEHAAQQLEQEHMAALIAEAESEAKIAQSKVTDPTTGLTDQALAEEAAVKHQRLQELLNAQSKKTAVSVAAKFVPEKRSGLLEAAERQLLTEMNNLTMRKSMRRERKMRRDTNHRRSNSGDPLSSGLAGGGGGGGGRGGPAGMLNASGNGSGNGSGGGTAAPPQHLSPPTAGVVGPGGSPGLGGGPPDVLHASPNRSRSVTPGHRLSDHGGSSRSLLDDDEDDYLDTSPLTPVTPLGGGGGGRGGADASGRFEGLNSVEQTLTPEQYLKKREQSGAESLAFDPNRHQHRHAQTYRRNQVVPRPPDRPGPGLPRSSRDAECFEKGMEIRDHAFNVGSIQELRRSRQAQAVFHSTKVETIHTTLVDQHSSRAPTEKVFATVRKAVATAAKAKDQSERLNVFYDQISLVAKHAVVLFPSKSDWPQIEALLDSVRDVVTEKDGKQQFADLEQCALRVFPPETLLRENVRRLMQITAPMFGVSNEQCDRWMTNVLQRFERRNMLTTFRAVEQEIGNCIASEVKFKIVVQTCRNVHLPGPGDRARYSPGTPGQNSPRSSNGQKGGAVKPSPGGKRSADASKTKSGAKSGAAGHDGKKAGPDGKGSRESATRLETPQRKRGTSVVGRTGSIYVPQGSQYHFGVSGAQSQAVLPGIGTVNPEAGYGIVLNSEKKSGSTTRPGLRVAITAEGTTVKTHSLHASKPAWHEPFVQHLRSDASPVVISVLADDEVLGSGHLVASRLPAGKMTRWIPTPGPTCPEAAVLVHVELYPPAMIMMQLQPGLDSDDSDD